MPILSGSFVAKKLLYMLLTLWMVVTITFVLMKSIPGDPFQEDRGLPPEIHQALRDHYGLDDPLLQQYVRYLKGIVNGDLGPSLRYKDRSVNDIIRQSFPASALLALQALCLSIGIGIPLGVFAATHQHQWQDQLAMMFVVLGVSIPNFILASLMQYLFALKLGWLPVARWGSFLHTVLPSIALASLPIAFIARLTRANMIEVLQQDYIKTAKAKGLSRTQVVWKHGLRNTLLPVVTYLGQLTANLLIGSFIVEKIFGIPGLGQWFVSSIGNRDYPVIMGVTIFFSFLLIGMTFLVDLLYRFIDPRMRRTPA